MDAKVGVPSNSLPSSSDLPQPQDGTQGSVTVTVTAGIAPDLKPKKKICCACPGTKRLRDECIVEHGEAACSKWIEAHRRCLRAEGFKV